MKRHIVHFPKDKYLKHNKLNDISKWRCHEGEWTGTREKFIISPPNSDYPRYMVKFPKYGFNETKIELFNCFLGLNLELKIASYFPCIYKKKKGVVTKSFLKNKSELWEMKELICHHSGNPNLKEKMGRDSDVLKEHDIDNIFLILDKEFGDKVLFDFFRMIGFDCLIGHGDRHWTNYGVILEERNQESINYKFAPIYDTASGYLLEMSDEKLREMIKTDELNDENWYKPKKKALCKIIHKQDIKTNHIELFEYIIDNSNFDQYIRYLVEPIERFNTKLVKYILKNGFYLKDLLPERQFAIIKILEMRKKILESIIERYKRQKNA